MSVRAAIQSAAATAHTIGLERMRQHLLFCATYDMRGASRASASAACWFAVAVVLARLAPRDLDVSAADADVDAHDIDESDSACCAAEGTGGLVVDVTAPTEDERLHDEEGSR